MYIVISFNSSFPFTFSFSKVYIGYCDGGSFSGKRSAPEVIKNANGKTRKLYFKGYFIMDAVYDHLLWDKAMNMAKEVVIGGSSAGGLAVFLNIDHLAFKIRLAAGSRTVVVGVPDGGYFMDVASQAGEYKLNPMFKAMHDFQNVTSDAECEQGYSYKDTSWKCLIPQYMQQNIKTPLFIVQSFIDSYQREAVMEIDECESGSKSIGHSCDHSTMTYINGFRKKMKRAITENLPLNSGFWLISCGYHTIANHDYGWNITIARHRNLRDTFLAWYTSVVDFVQLGKFFDESLFKEISDDYEYDDSSTC